MSGHDQVLQAFSIGFIILCVGAVLIPYVLGKRELFTTLNVFLAGSAIFVGVSGLYSVSTGHFAEYSSQTYLRFFLAISVFYATVLAGYWKLGMPERAARRYARKHPVVSSKGVTTLLLLSTLLISCQLVTVGVPGLANFIRMLGMLAPAFAIVFAFYAWDRHKANPIYLVLVVVTAMIALSSLFAMGGGRRALFGALFALPLCAYWRYMRKWRPWSVIAIFSAIAVPGGIFVVAYDAVRWAGTERRARVSAEVDGAGERLSMLMDVVSGMREFSFLHLAQTGVEYSLTTIDLYSEDHSEYAPSPMQTLYVLATLPVPRALWEDKPRHLGARIPFEAGILPWGTPTTAGPGIAGHIYHDGGLWVALVYGLLVGAALKYLDTLLAVRRNDPLLMAFFAASSFHILGWSRGDISTFSMWPVLSFGVMWFFQMASQIVGLTARTRITLSPSLADSDDARRVSPWSVNS